jgi:PAS domain S-box-containing protein
MERMLQRLNEAQRISQIGDWEEDLARKVLSWSPQMFEILGRDPLLGTPQIWSEACIFDDASLNMLAEKGAVTVASGEEQTFGLVALRPGAERILLQAQTLPRQDESGVTIGIHGILQDVTERRATEMKLRQSEDQLRLLIGGVTDYAILMLDAKGFIVSWNEGAERSKGYAAEEIIGCHFSKFYTPEGIKEGMPERQLMLAATLGRFEEEGLRVRKNGTQFLANVVITALRDETGKLRGFGKLTRDITIRKQAEADNNALLRTIHLHSIVSVADRAGRIIEVNDSFCAISGYSREELIGKTHQIVNSGFHSPEFWTAMWRDISNGKSWRGEICNRRKNGSLYWVDSIIAPFFGEDGRTTKFISIRTDITAAKLSEGQLRQATEKAEHANRAKSEFLANMSHEIRTPMNAIIGMTHLARRANPSPAQDNYLATIASSSESLLNIINDILDFSKIEAGKLLIENIPFSLTRLLNKVHDIVAYKAAEKRLQLKFSIATESPTLLVGDPLRLEQILINLVSNAIKFSDQGRVSLTVGSEKSEGNSNTFSFLVSDAGIGMTAQQVSQLFQSFNQGDSSTTRKYGGTGLGLAITKQLCELLHGSLSATSEPGKGSQFLFTVPFCLDEEVKTVDAPVRGPETLREILGDPLLGASLRDHAAEIRQTVNPVYRPGQNADRLKGKRVLLVEDNSINRRVATELLIDLGIAVTVAHNGREGVDKLKTELFDLVLMDIQMPVMDGLTAAALIRTDPRLKDLPLIAMTAHAMSGDREKSLAAGMSDHLTKPISPSNLTDTLLRWLPDNQAVFPASVARTPTELSLSAAGIPSELPPFDLEIALGRTLGKATLLRTILLEFRDEFANTASRLYRLVEEGELEEAERIAHTLKSVAATLEARDLAQASAALEAALHTGQMEHVAKLIATLSSALEPAISAVNSLHLPSERNRRDDGKTPAVNPLPKRLPCVLLIDDDAATVAVFNDAFQSGYEVLITSDGLTGLEMAAVTPPDVILLDVKMAGLDGFEVCRRFKADSKTADIPILFITGVLHLDAEIEGLKLGAVDYVVKPLNMAAVKAKVDNQIALKWAKDKLTLQAAKEVAASFARVHSVLESTSDHIMTLDREWRVIYANGNALNALPDLRIGADYWSCFPAVAGTPAERYLRNAMGNRTEEEYQLFYPPYERWYGVRVFPVDEGISVFFSDITDEKKIEDKLALEQLLREKRIEAMTHMAGGLAHEINNPLAIIHGRASELLSRLSSGELISSEDIRLACDSIVRTSDRAVKILRGLRGFAREAGQDPLEMASVYQIIDQCMEMQGNRLERHTIEARVDLARGIPDLMCREVQIDQILTNLLNNAIDAIVQSDARERWISLVATHSEGHIVIDVIDSGPGIEEHYKGHLMEPFFTTKGIGLGMGVGLSLSRMIAEDHGGSLTLCSGAEHTCFRLVLPIAAGSPAEEVPAMRDFAKPSVFLAS